MAPVLRRFLGILIGSGVAFGIVYMLEELAKQVTMPPGLDARNLEQVKFALEHGEFPFASLALVLCGWLLAAYVGSRLATSIGRARMAPLAFTVIFTTFTIYHLTLLPHPTWMWIGGAVGVPLIALGAAGESITLPAL